MMALASGCGPPRGRQRKMPGTAEFLLLDFFFFHHHSLQYCVFHACHPYNHLISVAIHYHQLLLITLHFLRVHALKPVKRVVGAVLSSALIHSNQHRDSPWN